MLKPQIRNHQASKVFSHRWPGALFFSIVILGFCCLSAKPSYAQSKNGAQCPVGGLQEDVFSLSARQLHARDREYAAMSGQVQLQGPDYRLRANRMIYDNKRKRLQAEDEVMFTRCDPRDPSWFITADRITLDGEKARVKNAWFIFGGTPLLYIPRYQIGLKKQRKSGFLTPKVSNKSSLGLEFGTPYYLNLAANQDATLTPRYLSKHGLQLQAEFRYLNRLDKGAVHAEWLNSRRYKSDRYAWGLEHRFHKGNYLNFDLSLQKVSDANYFQDLDAPLDKVAEQYLPSFIRLDYAARGWQFSIAGESLQRTDLSATREDRPYVHRPSVSLNKTWSHGKGFALEWNGDWTRFETRRSAGKPEGRRFNNRVGLQWDYRHPGFFLKPAFSLHHTRYSLNRLSDRNRDRSISRTLPIFSFYTGLSLSKALNHRFHNTLEPQLFYLYAAERKQDDIPLFDTGERDFRFAQLFRHNRFNGQDRIGDANRLVGALTTRVIHSETGKEALRASVGYIERLSRERTSLSPGANNKAAADLAAELAINMNGKIRFQAALAYDKDLNHSQHYHGRLSLVGAGNRALHLSHHYRRDEIRQIHLDFSQPLGERWNLLGSWQHDVRNHRGLDVLMGLEYKSCCWGMRLLAQRYLKDVDTFNDDALDYNRSIGIEFSFSGIGNVGSRNEHVLSKKINNYRPF